MYALIESNNLLASGKASVAEIYVTRSIPDGAWAEWVTDMYNAGFVIDILPGTERIIHTSHDLVSQTCLAIRRRSQSGFHRGHVNGPDNDMIWLISAEEYDALIKEDAAMCAAAEAKARAEELENWRDIIRRAERQQDIPTRQEARRRQTSYNNVYNEGGEGYVPDIIDRERYEYALRKVADLTA